MNTRDIELENESLAGAWDQYPASHLDGYLVRGVEDPRINAQSIFTRALVVDSLFPGRFSREIEAEMRFGVVLTWILRELESGRDRIRLLEDIGSGSDTGIPAVVAETFQWLQSPLAPVPDYITRALNFRDQDAPERLLDPAALDTFMDLWRSILPEAPLPRPSVLEAACGSANDYRFFSATGISGLIDYTGLDISAGNIANARRRHPDVKFINGSILSSRIADRSFDYVFAHDLFEHLSRSAIDLAVLEMARIARREVWLHLFRASEDGDHTITPQPPYYWNTISTSLLAGSFAAAGFDTQVVYIGKWLREKFGFNGHYNPMAATLLATRREAVKAP